jgi:hypothetical protein
VFGTCNFERIPVQKILDLEDLRDKISQNSDVESCLNYSKALNIDIPSIPVVRSLPGRPKKVIDLIKPVFV